VNMEPIRMSDAEVMALLDQAGAQYERYLSINQSTARLRDQLEVQFAPTYAPDAPIGLVIHGADGADVV
jgi:hypothetical protein